MTSGIVPSVVSPIASAENSADAHEVLERAFVVCLTAFADLVRASGQFERAERLRDALDILHEGSPANCSAVSAPASRTSAALAGALSSFQSLRPRLRLRPDGGRYRLTDRECEVAGLIARGLTNRQIAEILVISERTVDTHVQNILGKLSLISRAQVAIWFVEHDGHTPAAV